MKSLTRPCRRCPFLAEFKGDNDYLNEGRRAGIVASGGEFPCHNTVDYDAQDEDADSHIPGDDEAPCVGRDLLALRARNPHQMLRIRIQLGMTDPEALLAANADVELWTYAECITEEEPDDFEPCSVVDTDCEAPAGYMDGDGVVSGTESAAHTCDACGQPVCANCSTTRRDGEYPDGLRYCNDCIEYEDDPAVLEESLR